MKIKIKCLIIIFLFVVSAIPISGYNNIDKSELDIVSNRSIQIENIGFVFTIGNFTETETQYQGHFSYYIFFGIIGGEFYKYTVQDEILMLNKDLIIREFITTSRIIFARVVPR